MPFLAHFCKLLRSLLLPQLRPIIHPFANLALEAAIGRVVKTLAAKGFREIVLSGKGLPRVVIVVTNPLDVLTEYLVRRWDGRGVSIMGSGTSLDTLRFDNPVASTKWLSVISSAAAFSFIASTMACVPPG